jgi:hypothetical protein
VAIDKIEVNLLLPQELIDRTGQLFQQMAPAMFRMECETGCHRNMHRVRRAEALKIEMLLAFQWTIATHNDACARHNRVLLHRIEMMGPVIPCIPQLLSMRVGFVMPFGPVHFFNVDLVP